MDIRKKRTLVFGKTAVRLAAQAAVGWFLASGRVFGEYAPLGLGFVAAAGQGIFGLAGILGTALGYLCGLYRANGLKYLAITALILTERVVFRDRETPWVLPAAAALATALLGFVFLIDGGVHTDECVCFATEVLLVFGSAWVFGTARTKAYAGFPMRRRQCFFLCIAALFAVPLLRAELFSLSVGRILSYASVMTVGWFGGTGLSLVAAVIFGVTCGSMYPAVFGASALAAAGVRPRGRAAFLCAHLAAALFGMLLTRQSGLGAESLAASLVFVAVRRVGASHLRGLFAEGERGRDLHAAANAFSALHDTLARTLSGSRKGEPITCVFSRPARVVCRTCTRRDACWKDGVSETKAALKEAADAMQANRELKACDLPLPFAAQCLHIGEFLSETNRELAVHFCRREMGARLRESKARLCRSYRDMSRVLAGIAEEHPPKTRTLRASLGVAKKRKAGSTVCGDTVGHCRTPNGTVCVLLADGMGTGEGAARESRLAVDLLTRFLESGVDPQSALAVVSSALTFKCEETHAFTTLDLLCADLSDGVCTLYRFGSAPAYFRVGGKIECVTCTSMPLGLACEETPSVDRVTRTLRAGEDVILMSDGVSDEIRPGWLMQTIRDRGDLDPQALAKEILSRAEGCDDRTVLVLRMCEQEG